MIRSVDPNKNYLWDWSPSKGKSRGILTGLRLDSFDVGSRTQGDFILMHVLWDKKLGKKWCLLNVYGHAQDEKKEDFLRELASFCAKCKDPSIVVGVNILRYSF
jgi:hypothetical protein